MERPGLGTAGFAKRRGGWRPLRRISGSHSDEEWRSGQRTCTNEAGSSNLCLAGGVPLNCVTNRHAFEQGQFAPVRGQRFDYVISSDEGYAQIVTVAPGDAQQPFLLLESLRKHLAGTTLVKVNAEAGTFHAAVDWLRPSGVATKEHAWSGHQGIAPPWQDPAIRRWSRSPWDGGFCCRGMTCADEQDRRVGPFRTPRACALGKVGKCGRGRWGGAAGSPAGPPNKCRRNPCEHAAILS